MWMEGFKREKVEAYSDIRDMMWQFIALWEYYLASSITSKDVIAPA